MVRSFVRSFVVVREEECEGAGSFDVVSEPGSFVVVRVLASELALSAAGPCVPRRHVPPGHEAADGAQGSPIFFYFSFGFLCVCVCVVRPRPRSRNRLSCPCVA